MKKLLLFSLFSSLIFVPVAAMTTEQMRADLTRFSEFAQRCQDSLRTAKKQAVIDSFRAVSSLLRKNRAHLKNIDTASENLVQELHTTCTEMVNTHLQPRRTPTLVTGHNEPPRSPELLANVQLPLGPAVSLLTAQFEGDLLKPTTLSRWAQRVGLQTVVETAALSSACALDVHLHPDKQSDPAQTRAEKKTAYKVREMTPVANRLSSIMHINNKWLGGNIIIAFARLGGHCAVNEWVPRGISSYWQRLTELVLPVLLAGAATYGLAKSDVLKMNTKMRNSLIGKSMMRAFMRLAMTRFLLPKSNKLYIPANILAFALPFYMGYALKVVQPNIGKGKTTKDLKDWNTYINILLDGGIAMGIYEGIPALMNKVLPRRGGMNPAHRRDTMKKMPREVATEIEKMMREAVASAV